MIRSWRDGVVCVLLASGVVTTGCESDRLSPYFAELRRPDTPPQHFGTEYELEFIAEYGELDGDRTFTRIAAVAAHPAGMIAVSDVGECQVILIDVRTGDFSRLGGCGGGPGEFSELDVLTFHGDTIVAFDRAGRHVVFLDLLGNEIRRVRPTVLTRQRPWFASLGSLNDSTLVAGLELVPSFYPDADNELLANWHSSSGITLRRYLRDAPLALVTQRNILRGVRVCTNRETPVTRLAVANSWASQILTYTGDGDELLANFGSELEWWAPTDDDRGEMQWRPPGPYPSLACGREHIAVMHKRRSRTDDGMKVTNAHLEVRTYDGEVVLRMSDSTPAKESILLLSPAAAQGNRFYFFTNSYADFPVVREYRLTEVREQQE